ncbi:MAG: 4Fe-4S binding protein [Gemmatimonadetes bacterium]|nr:4Fe-4S binding protein [Gemmatimonadota bacterium]
MTGRSQWLRHTVQFAVLAGMVVLAILASRGVATTVTGNTWVAHVAGFPIVDPLAGAEGLVARGAARGRILLAVLVPVLVTLVLGRVFCSWICPAGFLFEATDRLRGFLKQKGFRPGNVRFRRGHKYVLLALGLALSAFLAMPLLGHFYPPALVVREIHRAVFSWGNGAAGIVTGGALFLLFLVTLELVASPRAWCRSFCPGGALYSLLGARRPVRVRLEESRCTKCADCVPVCPMALNPMLDRMGAECDNCLACVSVCPDEALSFRSTKKERQKGGV